MIRMLTINEAKDETKYKLDCYCVNCGAQNISVQRPIGTRTISGRENIRGSELGEIVCPRCKCKGVDRMFNHPQYPYSALIRALRNSTG